jgi:hypothetical protein
MRDVKLRPERAIYLFGDKGYISSSLFDDQLKISSSISQPDFPIDP